MTPPCRRHPSLRAAHGFAVWASALLWAGHAAAFINPRFTPVDLVNQAETVLAGCPEAGAGTNQWRLTNVEVIKGAPPSKVALDLAACKPAEAADVRRLLAANGRMAVLLAAGNAAQGQGAYLHANGTWLRLTAAENGRWNVNGFDQKMSGTFAGGTDMLIRLARAIRADPETSVPSAVGTAWADHASIGRVAGDVSGLAAVERPGGSPPALFVGAAGGDRLFVPAEDAWQDRTATAGLDSRSLRFAWLDLNRDGRTDLVTWDGATLGVRLAVAGGGFTNAASSAVPLKAGRLELSAAGLSNGGAPRLVVDTNGVPFALEWTGDARGAWRRAPLPAGGTTTGDEGPSAACVVADLDNDGFVDVLQVHAEGSRLWRGTADGFAAPVASAVAAGEGGAARWTLGDFDGDGFLDLFLSTPTRNGLWENDGKADFRDVIEFAGSLAYKTPAGIADCRAADLNEDGRTDLALCYADAGLMYHFNRGFRCFGEEGGLRLPEAEGDELPGVNRCLTADLNADGAEDFVAAFADGRVCGFFNERLDMPAVRLRLERGAIGPVTVSVWQGKDDSVGIGTYLVYGRDPVVAASLRRAGPCVLKWTIPGRGPQRRDVDASASAPEVELKTTP